VDELKKQLLMAIENEDFEKAAELRDQLKALEKEAQV
jgi:protein-arginine kinase activator protein McsA